MVLGWKDGHFLWSLFYQIDCDSPLVQYSNMVYLILLYKRDQMLIALIHAHIDIYFPSNIVQFVNTTDIRKSQ